MAPTITRLILSFALMVAAPVVYTIAYVTYVEIQGWSNDEMGLLMADIVVGLGFAGGWLVVWWGEVRWSVVRAAVTALVFFASVVLAVMIGLVIGMMMEEELGYLFGGMIWAVLWLFGTSLAWMELPGERRRRMDALGAGEVACPNCGYNMTGLKETRCPECGGSYTVDRLFAAHMDQRRTFGRDAPT